MAFESSSLNSICLPASIKTIGEFCFAGCSSLSSVTFEPGAKLSKLGRAVFQRSSLETIFIPSSSPFDSSCFTLLTWHTPVSFERVREPRRPSGWRYDANRHAWLAGFVGGGQ
jgi:hypothetical protein